jgi:hypothetical protein
MAEAARVLKPRGMLWVKSQDEIECGHHRWTRLEIYDRALALSYGAQDLFVLLRPSGTVRVKHQLHARKNGLTW